MHMTMDMLALVVSGFMVRVCNIEGTHTLS